MAEENKKSKIIKKVYWIFMAVWTIGCICASVIFLDWFYCFLKEYQQVYDETRPKVMMDEIVTEFDEADVEWILDNSNPIALSAFEEEDTLKQYISDFMKGKKVSYKTKAGEHIEERPVYVVTLENEPFAVVRLEKQEVAAKFGHPLWQLKEIELLVTPRVNRTIVAAENATVSVNGILLSDEYITETTEENEKAYYYAAFPDQVTLPGYKTYKIENLFTEPEVTAVNFLGESMNVVYEEKEKTYRADFGMSESLKQEVEEYVIKFMKDYSMYTSNDLGYSGLDKYFPKGSEILKGLKNGSRNWFDDHKKPEIMNEELKDLVLFTDNAFSARVYLEQYMYVPFSGRIELLVTDLNVYYIKLDGEWKVSGIAFE